MRRLILVLSLLLVSFAAVADSDDEAELKRLQGALILLNQEQQAVYQQFQMVQELRHTNAQGFANPVPSPYVLPPPGYTGEVQNYADVVEAQKSQIRHTEELAERAEQLYAKYGEIEARKKPIQQRIYELTLSKSK